VYHQTPWFTQLDLALCQDGQNMGRNTSTTYASIEFASEVIRNRDTSPMKTAESIHVPMAAALYVR
jgi:hypothetical protein